MDGDFDSYVLLQRKPMFVEHGDRRGLFRCVEELATDEKATVLQHAPWRHDMTMPGILCIRGQRAIIGYAYPDGSFQSL